MKNLTCGLFAPNSHSYFVLNKNCLTSDDIKITAVEYGALAATGYVLFIVTYIFYNKVNKLPTYFTIR